MKKHAVMLATGVMLGLFASAVPSVSDVVVHQQWPWSPEIRVTFNVSGLEATQAMDVALDGVFDGESVRIPPGVIKGITKCLTAGEHTLSFNPMDVPALADRKSITDFNVRVTSTLSTINLSEVLYMIVDLENPQNEVQYLTRADILSGAYGTYELEPSWIQDTPALEDCLIWTGVTNDVYKTTKLVLRKIRKGEFRMGSLDTDIDYGGYNQHPHQVMLTQDYWIGVFELTAKQHKLLTGISNQGDMLPVRAISYNSIRGDAWPGSTAVAEDSFIATVRTKTGLAFDLPTEAQWEYACRAGTTTTLNNGSNLTATGDTAWCENLAELGRFGANAFKNDSSPKVPNKPATVGSYKPNAWGLYDMHGNVGESCLDWLGWFAGDRHDVTDPSGAETGTLRVAKGGNYYWGPNNCTSGMRGNQTPTVNDSFIGLRLVCPVTAE